jgi:hypothetical protein
MENAFLTLNFVMALMIARIKVMNHLGAVATANHQNFDAG